MSDIVIAPFSNSAIRDWPSDHFSALIGLLVERWSDPDGVIWVIGTAGQRLRANEIVRSHPADRVVNSCGRLPWPKVVEQLGQAACVIGNNSGVAHLAGSLGVPTVCIFGGSHQRLEWRPLGADVVLLSRTIGCSPCHLDHGRNCRYGLACLREITPDEVAEVTLAAIGRSRATRQDKAHPAPSRVEEDGVIA